MVSVPSLYHSNEIDLLHPEVLTQVDIFHLFVGENFLSIPLGNDLTIVDDVGFLADVQCFPDIVISQKYAYVPRFEMLNDFFDFTNGDGVDSREWIIQ